MRPRLLALPVAVLSVAASLAVLPGGGAAASSSSSSSATSRPRTAAPLVFAHRGASGYRPEHTLAAYDLAIRQGADVIEPDLVPTRDGVLVARHENEISETTDVETKFPGLRRTKSIDGRSLTGWFTEDLTLAQLRTLRAEERLPLVRQENTVLDGRYPVPTFDEVLALAKAASRRHGRTIGVAPETKHPTYFDSIRLSLEERVLRDLREAGMDRPGAPVFIQSFEEAGLRDLRRLGARVRLVQLTSATGRPYDHVALGDPQTYADMTTPRGLREVRQYAQVLGPDKSQIFPRDAEGRTGAATSLVADAHAARLLVVPYTVRAENQFLPLQHRRGTDPTDFGDVLAELRELYATGIDGIFADQPDLALVARDER